MKAYRLTIFAWLVSPILAVSLLCVPLYAVGSQEVFSPQDVLRIKYGDNARISPDGKNIAYTVRVPRLLDDKPGPAYSELSIVSVSSGRSRPYISGKVNVDSPRWSPDGSRIAFLMKRGEEAKTQVWTVPFDGGESHQITNSKTDVTFFQWHPEADKIAYIATTPPSKREKELKKKGFDFVYYEEDLKDRNLYMIDAANPPGESEAQQLTENVTVWRFVFSPDGGKIAAAISEKNLIDYSYMFRSIYLIDVASKSLERVSNNPGKLGNFCFSPNGNKLVYTAAEERSDHAVSQVYVMDANGGISLNLTPQGFRGHVHWAAWKDNDTVVYLADEGVWTTLSLVKAEGGKRKVILDSRNTGSNFQAPDYSEDFKHFALSCTSPSIPGDIFYWQPGKKPKRLTNLNSWIAERKLGEVKVIRYSARDSLEIEGLLVYPVGYDEAGKHPLIVTVHGGPESHYANAWHTSYFQPDQVLAGEGYVVFLPNYRSSTGYGVEFAKQGYGDAAGKEFDDIADGIIFLEKHGIADPERVGLGGGSYGGYAAAWFSSRYTEYVKAVCMFVGISDLISKRGTTDIPYEELYVHSGEKLEQMWEKSLKRSPIYYAHQSKTAVLILGGTADTRVHPSQSLEYYRRLKMNGHPAVRLVQYPGEHHGNRNQPGRADVLYRSLQWYNWYIKDKKPIDGPMPPLDISESYGIELDD